jgi:hypothetical protein
MSPGRSCFGAVRGFIPALRRIAEELNRWQELNLPGFLGSEFFNSTPVCNISYPKILSSEA